MCNLLSNNDFSIDLIHETHTFVELHKQKWEKKTRIQKKRLLNVKSEQIKNSM